MAVERDEALEHDGLVARFQDVGAMAENDLELSRRIFRDQRLGRQALDFGIGIEIVEERREIVEVLEIVGLVVLRPGAARRRARRQGPAGQRRVAIHEEEFELDGTDRRQAERLEAACDVDKEIARIGIVAAAVEIADGGEVLRRRLVAPRHRHQAAGNRPQEKIAVAFVPNEPGLDDIGSGDVEGEGGDRKEAAVAPGGHDLVAPQDLAALDAAQVGPHEVDALHVGMGGEERLGGVGLSGSDHGHATRPLRCR